MIGTITERFMMKVDQRGPAECWPWIGATNSDGYGSFRVAGRSEAAQRRAWTEWVGLIPVGLHVLHRCDNPPCVNPAHLFLGTHGDNMRDRAAKGRDNCNPLRGSANHASMLTEEMIAPIVCCARAGVTHNHLARWFGIGRQGISKIVARTHWSHVVVELP